MANENRTPDELDLSQIFTFLQKIWEAFFNAVLSVFKYLKKYALILLGLMIVGVAISFGLNKLVPKKHRTEVIVKPNHQSKEYLNSTVAEIQSKIDSKDNAFFESLDIDVENVKGYSVSVVALDNVPDKVNYENLEYLELLNELPNQDLVNDVLRAEILAKTNLNYKIIFSYPAKTEGYDIAQKLMSYINENTYYHRVNEVNIYNAKSRIAKNKEAIEQIDRLLKNYTDNLGQNKPEVPVSALVLAQENGFDAAALFNLKNGFLKDIESLELKIVEMQSPINIISFGKSHEIQTSVFGERIVWIPAILIALFVFYTLLAYLNVKAKETTV